MGPKVEAARRFVLRTGKRASIGSLENAEGLLRGESGTTIVSDASSPPPADLGPGALARGGAHRTE